MMIKAVYHIACMGEHWRDVVSSQLSRMQGAGWAFPIKITVNADSIIDVLDLQGILKAYQLDTEIVTHRKMSAFEHPALYHVRYIAEHDPKGKTIYLHSKGVSKYPKAERWRDTMDFFTIHQWEQNIKRLDDEGADVIGAMFWDLKLNKGIKIPHYSGNFWTAKNEYINRLMSLEGFRLWARNRVRIAHENPDRMCAEMYICSIHLSAPKYKPKFLECYQSIEPKRPAPHLSFDQLKSKYQNESI